MVKKATKEVKKPRKKQSGYFFATPIQKLKMFKLHKEGVSILQISKKYSCDWSTANKIIQQEIANEKPVKKEEKEFSSKLLGEMEKRKELDNFERTKLISRDALEVVEMAVSLVSFKIKQTVDTINETGNTNALIEIDKLTRFLQTTLPYVLPKQIDTPGSKSRKENTTPQMKLHRLMNNTKTA